MTSKEALGWLDARATLGCKDFNDEKRVNEYIEIIEKDLNMLEIIKNKRVNLDYLRGCKELEDYNNILIEKWQLTEIEFHLIKEWLNE